MVVQTIPNVKIRLKLNNCMKHIFLILSLISTSCNTKLMAEPEQEIVLTDDGIVIIQSDPEDENANTYIYGDGIKPIVCSPAGDGATFCQ